MERGVKVKGSDETDPRAFDTDAVLVSQEEIEEQFGQVRAGSETPSERAGERAPRVHVSRKHGAGAAESWSGRDICPRMTQADCVHSKRLPLGVQGPHLIVITVHHRAPKVSELNKAINDIKSEHAFALHRKTTELMEELKQVSFGMLWTRRRDARNHRVSPEKETRVISMRWDAR